MNSWLLLSLFTAHLVGDFYCQNDKLCRQKEAFKIKSRFLYAHSLIIGILSWIMVPQTGFIIYAFVIAVSHWLIDLSKLYCKERLSVFIFDQLLHIAVILAVSVIYDATDLLPLQKIDNSFSLSISLPLLIAGVLFCCKPTNILIKKVLQKYQLGEGASCKNMRNAGALIGSLERLLTLIFVLIGQYGAIGFVIAAKSILRFKDSDTDRTEYVLVGTLLSFGIAIAVGLITVKIKM